MTIVLYGLALTAVLGCLAVSGTRRGLRTGAALALVQVATTGLAVVDAAQVLPDLDGSDAATHAGYLLTAVVVLPISRTVAGTDRGRWGNATMAVACLLLVVVVARVQQTAHA